MILEIIKITAAVGGVIAYAVMAVDCSLAERREKHRAERARWRLGCKHCRDMYRNWTRGKFDEPEDGDGDKHLNIICKDPAIAPAFG